MHILNDIFRVKQLCFLLLILTFSTNMQAESTSSSPNTGSHDLEPDQSGYHQRQRMYYFPRWPEQKTEQREIVPPPPSGPYMSSALTLEELGLDDSPFTHKQDSVQMPVRSDVSISAFSPDIPWPSMSDSPKPNRWQPETGYHYVQPQSKDWPYRVAPSNYQQGYTHQVVNRSMPVRQRSQLYSEGGQSPAGYRYDRRANNVKYPSAGNP